MCHQAARRRPVRLESRGSTPSYIMRTPSTKLSCETSVVRPSTRGPVLSRPPPFIAIMGLFLSLRALTCAYESSYIEATAIHSMRVELWKRLGKSIITPTTCADASRSREPRAMGVDAAVVAVPVNVTRTM